MKNKYTQIFLTLELRGKSLVHPGVYNNAMIKVENGWTSKEVMTIIKPMTIEKEPVWESSTKVTTLGPSFIEMALNRPRPPRNKGAFHKWLRGPEGYLYNNWARLNDDQKIRVHLNELATYYGAEIKNFTLM